MLTGEDLPEPPLFAPPIVDKYPLDTAELLERIDRLIKSYIHLLRHKGKSLPMHALQ